MLDLVFNTIGAVLMAVGTLTGVNPDLSHTVAVSAVGVARTECVLPAHQGTRVPGNDVFVSAGQSVYVPAGTTAVEVAVDAMPVHVFPEAAGCPPQTKDVVVTDIHWTRALVQVFEDPFGPMILQQGYVLP